MGFEPTILRSRVTPHHKALIFIALAPEIGPESMGRVVTPGGDLLDDLLDDLVTPCAGTLRSTAFPIYESGN